MTKIPGANDGKGKYYDRIVRTPAKDSPVAFFALTFLLSVPFYIHNVLAYLNVVFGPEMGALYVSFRCSLSHR